MPSFDHVLGSISTSGAGQPTLVIEDALVLEASVPAEEHVRPLARRRPDLLVIVQRLDPLGERLAEGDLVEIPEGHLVLRLDPGGGLRGGVILEPVYGSGTLTPW